MSDNQVDKLIEELEAEKTAQTREEEQLSEALRVDGDTAQRIQEERQSKVSGFQLNLNLEEDFPQPEAADTPPEPDTPADSGAPDSQDEPDGREPPVPPEDEPPETDEPDEEPDDAEEDEPSKKKKKKGKSGSWGCLKGIIYGVLVLGISGVLAYFAITGGIDITGLRKQSYVVDVEIPQGASTQMVANILEKGGLIDQPLVFRLYSKLTKADGTYQPGTFSLQPSMGYAEIIETLQNTKPRESIRVTIQEGSTIEDIAKILNDKNVCSSADFFKAVLYGEFDYDFIREIPSANDGPEYEGRIYKLEGYMFPDTYEFFEKSSGETVVKKFLDNFGAKLDTNLRAAIKAQNMTIDKAIIIASIIQGEAASESDMAGVSRVIYNRLANTAEYPKLQCDSTGDYVNKLYPQVDEIQIVNTAYDTYKRNGLPVGAINNPGLQAIRAALFPSEDADIMKCYFFATASDGTTYFTKNYAEHVKICRKYNIGIHAQD